MTYFTFERKRGTRSQTVFVGSTPIGRISVVKDWRSRLTLSPNGDDLRYRAAVAEGPALAELFVSRHHAAEALLEAHARVAGGSVAAPERS